MRFSHGILLPHGLERIAFRNVCFLGAVRLDMCRYAAPTQDRGAGQLVYHFWPVLGLVSIVKLAVTERHDARQACCMSLRSLL